MTEILSYMESNPFMTFSLIVMFYYSIKIILFVLPNRIMRHGSIFRHGYPPAHCDADGDFKDLSGDTEDVLK